MRDATLAKAGAENLVPGPTTSSARSMSTPQGSLRKRALNEAGAQRSARGQLRTHHQALAHGHEHIFEEHAPLDHFCDPAGPGHFRRVALN